MWRWRGRTDDDFNEEIRANIALDADRFIAEGMNPDEARRAALRAFGNVTRAQERFHEASRVVWLDGLGRDVRCALRTLHRNPGFATVVVVTLALGIGVNTAIFSVINTVVLRSLPVERPNELVELLFKFPGDPRLNSYWWKHYEQFRERTQVLSELVAVSPVQLHVAGEAIRPEVVTGMYVVGQFFDVLGVRPAIGRLIGPQDDRVGSSDALVAIINEAMARHYFGSGDPLGRQFTFEGQSRPLRIVGVVGDAKYNDLHETPPRTAYMNVLQGGNWSPTLLFRTSVAPTSVVADVRRVVSDVLPDVAIARVDTLADQLDASILPVRMIAMLSTMFGILAALLVAIGLYGLLAFTVVRRTNEIGVRLALGATASDVRRMVLMDGLRLAGAGLLVGVSIAWWAKGYAASALSVMTVAQANAPVTLPVAGVPSLVVASIGILAVALVASYVPALRATKVDPMVALRGE